jgi:hypothetical protein
MSTAYTAAAWTGFGTAVATAAAALAGLLFIAISINIETILKIKSLPSRAAQTLILFASALIVAVLVVVPGQARVALGVELLATGLIIGAIQVWLDLGASRARGPEDTVWRRIVGRVFPAVLSCACLGVAGATLIAAAGGGLYWLVPSVVAALVFGMINAWVLLVEILR